MSNERFFRMLSIALLGALALACVPDSQASSPVAAQIIEIRQQRAVPVEIEVVREVESINAGRFNPAVAGDELNAENSRQIQTAATTQFDPNF